LGLIVAADCERVHEGLIGQPANTVSAAGYLLAGGWLLVQVGRRPGAPRYRWFAAAVAANGAGSMLYHGPGWPGSGWCHDVAAIAVPAFVAVDGLATLRQWDDATTTKVWLVTTGLAAGLVLIRPATNVAFLTAVAAAVLAETALRRRPGSHNRARAVLLTAL